MLGYSYFLKAKAELTFREARKLGITLKEDFSEKESELFTINYFSNKAQKSLVKSAAKFEGWPDVKAFVCEYQKKEL